MRFFSFKTLRIFLYFGLPLIMFLGLLIGNQSWLPLLDSDSLQIVEFYRDIFVDNYPISSWNLPSCPYFFPDMAFLIPLLRIAPDMGYAFVSYSFLFFPPLLMMLVIIAATATKDWFWSFLCVFSLGLFFVSLSTQREYALLYYRFFYPNFHASQILPGFALVAIVMRSMDKGYSYFSGGVFLLLASVTIASDLLIFPQFILPLIITVCVFLWLRLLPLRVVTTTLLLSVASYLLAMLALKILEAMEIFTIASSFGRFSLDWRILLENVSGFIRDMKDYWDSNPLLFLTFYASILFAVVYLVIHRHRFFLADAAEDDPDKSATPILFVLCFSLISVAGTIVGPIAINRWAGDWCIHYMQVLFVFPLLLLSIFLVSQIVKGRLWPKIAVAIVIVVSSCAILFGGDSLDFGRLKLPYPKSVQCLDALAGEQDLHYGYGGYWQARYTKIFSRTGLRVNQLDKHLGFFQWMNNNAWYCSIPGGNNLGYPKYEFIFVYPTTRENIERRFGDPARVEYCNGIQVFVYNRKGDVAFRNFLRIPALIINGKELPASPASPTFLSQYKSEGSPVDESETLGIPPGGEVELGFDAPASGDILEIATDANIEYAIDFLADDTLIDSVRVAVKPGTGFRINYIPMPISVCESSFTGLVVRNLSDNKLGSVGHIFVYEDSY